MADDQQLSLLEVFNRKHCSLSIASLKQDTSGATPYPLGVGEATAGERSAILYYTIIENYRRRSVDPFAHLGDVLTRLPLDGQMAGQRHHLQGVGKTAALSCS